MKSRPKARSGRYLRALLLGGVLLLPLGGCPVNGDDVLLSIVQAAVDAASSSFIDSFSAYLAGR